MYRNCPIIVAIVGFVVLLFAIICSWYAFPKLIDHEIAKRLAMVEGNEAFNFWKKPPFALKFKAFFFNVTNPSEVQMGASPILKEIGPYVFDEYWEKVNVSINEEADTIEYMLKRTFFYNEKETGCRSANDVVTMINGALLITALQVYMMLPSAMPIVNDAVPYLYKGAKDVFIRATIRDILFDGILITCHDPEVDFICGAIKGMLPPNIQTANNGSDFKFSLFGYVNSSLTGPFVMGRGLKNTTRGQILTYQGKNEMDVWPGSTCNMINGSDSTLFNPLKTPPEKLYAFGPDICRSLFVSYDEDYLYEGIPTWKFTSKAESLSYTGVDDCFCPRVQDENYGEVAQCPASGLLNIMACVQAPILVSNPHFYLGDPALIKYARGLKPEKHLHESFMYFEPITGSPVSGAKRLQMNVELKRFEDFTLLNNVSEGVCPMLWVEEVASVPPDLRDQLSSALHRLGLLDVFKWVLVFLGILIMVSALVLVMYKERLMCFANASSRKVAITEVKKSTNKMQIAEPISEMNFNNTVLYPSLYPQINDKNVNDRLIRRNNFNVHGKNAWEYTN